MGNFVTIHPENHLFSDNLKPIRLQGVEHTGIKIGSNCWIGAKSMILDGAEIGDGCVIAGGSVVLKGIYETDSVYAGNPARFVRPRTGVKM
jgi:acetyltransferase-like isoleucine patch superfamily enzyme